MRILWIGAHPDDELFVAPWLGAMVESQGAHCGFLVATRGEKGDCHLPEGCLPDLGTVREREMREAAALFGGEVWFAGCRDGVASEPDDVLRIWARDAGGMRALQQRFLGVIEQFRPDRIATFNRWHGCTWHADHRAIGILIQALALPIPVTLAESRLTFDNPLTIEAGDPAAEEFDSRATWDYLMRNLACHRSQMPAEIAGLFACAPLEQRRTWLTHRERWHRWSKPLDDVLLAFRRLLSHTQLSRLRRLTPGRRG